MIFSDEPLPRLGTGKIDRVELKAKARAIEACIDRRTLLIGGGAGIGLIVAFSLWPRELGSALAADEGEQVFGHYLKIAEDGQVTVAVPQAETGQGIWTGLAQLAADELGAAWESVAVVPAPDSPVYANRLLKGRVTAGATSVRAFEEPLRARRRHRARPAGAGRRRAAGMSRPPNASPPTASSAMRARRLGFGAARRRGRAGWSRPTTCRFARWGAAARRPAAAAPRLAGQIRRLDALCRRCPAARHGLRRGPPGAAGRRAEGLFARRRGSAAGPAGN